MRKLILLPVFASVLICLFFAQDASAIAVVKTITGFNSPDGVAYDSAKKEIFVANSGSNSVSIIS